MVIHPAHFGDKIPDVFVFMFILDSQWRSLHLYESHGYLRYRYRVVRHRPADTHRLGVKASRVSSCAPPRSRWLSIGAKSSRSVSRIASLICSASPLATDPDSVELQSPWLTQTQAIDGAPFRSILGLCPAVARPLPKTLLRTPWRDFPLIRSCTEVCAFWRQACLYGGLG